MARKGKSGQNYSLKFYVFLSPFYYLRKQMFMNHETIF